MLLLGNDGSVQIITLKFSYCYNNIVPFLNNVSQRTSSPLLKYRLSRKGGNLSPCQLSVQIMYSNGTEMTSQYEHYKPKAKLCVNKTHP